MKTKILFFVVLLALAPTFSTVSYGQAALQRLASGLLRKAVEKRNNAKALDVKNDLDVTDVKNDLDVTNDSGKENNSTNSNDEVTLVVFGKAVDSEKATDLALRSAIEQAYGVFVSANTTILNDDLVKDEIVTISNGNIKSYKVLSDVKCEDGQEMVTVKATVCISKLISYAKSKGASTEFAGATFAQNMKMKELNKKNELQALQNVLSMTKELLQVAFDKKLYVLDPTIPTARINYPSYLDPYLIKQYNNYQNLTNGYYEMVMNVVMESNDNTDKALRSVYETLKSISLRKEEIAEYEKIGMTISKINIFIPGYCKSFEHYWQLTFRNSKEAIDKWLLKFISLFASEFSNFAIVDNLGNSSTFQGILMAIDNCTHDDRFEGTVSDKKRLDKDGIMNLSGGSYFTQGTGLFKEGVNIYLHLPKYEYSQREASRLILSGNAYWIIKFRIPASEISKYSDFKLMPKNK